MIAEVIVDILNKQVNRSFDYLVPSHLEKIIKVGFRVNVPFGKTNRVGFVVGLKDSTLYAKGLRTISDVIDIYPLLNLEFIELAKYIATNNFSFYATALETMIPSALKIKYKKVARLNTSNPSIELKEIFKRKEINLDSLDNDKLKIIYDEASKGNVILDTILKKKKDSNIVKFVKLIDDAKATSKKGKMLLDYLVEFDDLIELDLLTSDMGYSKDVIQTLEKNGAISIVEKEIIEEKNDIEYQDIRHDLNKYQQNAIEKIDLSYHDTYLIHGITGSGKTEVYMELIEKAINNGKDAIMLVPEISLTPQITALFKARFKSNIAILHSRLKTLERYNEWKRIYNGDVHIVVGARSAIFAPLNKLGVIIIDEEHEASYNQLNNPKYKAIDIAIKRGENHNCPVVLGSATPRISDYYKALEGEYNLITLPERTNKKPLPKAKVINMADELRHGNKSVLSKDLQDALKKRYKNGEQSILFLNRRGYASFVMCRNCGEAIKCPHCDVALTYHSRTQSLKCHYCGFERPNVSRCEECGSDKIRFVGSGTEKIAEAASLLIPEAKIIRLDLDTTSKLIDYEEAFNKFKNKEADILVGTQMITKGLDFENVTLVGVVNADLALNYPLFDACEVAYDLIEQVSGRAGRSNLEGEVIIQTYKPNHYVIETVKNHDYDGFYNIEIRNRRLSSLPPYSNLVEIAVSSKDCNLCFNEAKTIVTSLKNVSSNSIILGPAEDFIFKKNDVFTFKIQIKVLDDEVEDKIREIYPYYQSNKDINISITRM